MVRLFCSTKFIKSIYSELSPSTISALFSKRSISLGLTSCLEAIKFSLTFSLKLYKPQYELFMYVDTVLKD